MSQQRPLNSIKYSSKFLVNSITNDKLRIFLLKDGNRDTQKSVTSDHVSCF